MGPRVQQSDFSGHATQPIRLTIKSVGGRYLTFILEGENYSASDTRPAPPDPAGRTTSVEFVRVSAGEYVAAVILWDGQSHQLDSKRLGEVIVN